MVALMALAVVSGCSQGGQAGQSASAGLAGIDALVVGTQDNGSPAINWPEGAGVSKEEVKVMWPGEGQVLTDGQPLLLDVYIEDLSSGVVLRNTHPALAESTVLAPELLGEALYKALLTVKVGARIVAVSPPAGEFEDEPPLAIVIDVLDDRAHGVELDVPEGLPAVTEAPDGRPLVSIDPKVPFPRDVTVATLIQGEGEQVSEGSYIVAQFVAVHAADGALDQASWKAGDLQQSTWDPEVAPFVGQVLTGSVVDAWVEGLIDQAVGSRVMILAPELSAYPGRGPIVYVIDILDVLNVDASGNDPVIETPSPNASLLPSPTAGTGGA